MTRPPVSARRFSLPLARKKCSVHPASLSLNVERCRSPVSLISPVFSSSVAECDITGLQEVQELGGGIHLKERHVGNDKVSAFPAQGLPFGQNLCKSSEGCFQIPANKNIQGISINIAS